jgi:hypothetical protein
MKINYPHKAILALWRAIKSDQQLSIFEFFQDEHKQNRRQKTNKKAGR